MTTTTNVPKTETNAKIDEAKKAILKEAFIKAAQGYLGAFVSFTAAIKAAYDAGVTREEVKEWGKEAGLTDQGINKALRKVYGRVRGLRCDFGISKMGIPSIGVRGPAKEKEDDEEGDDDKEEGTEGGSDTKTPEGLAEYILRICGGDKAKAVELSLGAASILSK